MKWVASGKCAPAAVKAVVADPKPRVVAEKSLVEGVGGTFEDEFFVRGTYDFASIPDMPIDGVVAAIYAIVHATGPLESVSIHTEMDIAKVASIASPAMGSYSPPSSARVT